MCRQDGATKLMSLGSLLGSGDTPEGVSRLLLRRFEQAAEECQRDKTCVVILFIDECDALLSSHVVAGMLGTLLDRTASQDGWHRIMVVGATNSIDSIPSFLRRPGRFDIEYSVAPPTAKERMSILASLMAATSIFSQPDPKTLQATAEECVGFVAADLVALVRRAVVLAVDAGNESIGLDILRKAMIDVEASALRSSRSSMPSSSGTQWKDIAGDPGRALVGFRTI